MDRPTSPQKSVGLEQQARTSSNRSFGSASFSVDSVCAACAERMLDVAGPPGVETHWLSK
jgi:hypothetical protein